MKNEDVELMNVIRDIYKQYPFYGYRRVHVELLKMGYLLNKKKTQRLMQLTGLRAIYPQKKTTIRNKDHAVYPYLLKGLSIDRPNQAWATDITYIKMPIGFVYLVALIDIFSRRIMGWSLSTFLDTRPCIEALENAFELGYTPEIINSDQGCQFTSNDWIEQLKQHNIAISMDGKGRWADNIYIERFWRSIKYEAIYLNSFENVSQVRTALKEYILFYNEKRPHQALNYRTPNEMFYQDNLIQKGKYLWVKKTDNLIAQNRVESNSLIFN